jgi:uncharacterized protein (DUF302 family)
MMSYGHTITLELPFPDAVAKVKDAFGAQGFGTLTEIDVQTTSTLSSAVSAW